MTEVPPASTVDAPVAPRDDFSKKTRRQVAEEVAFRCSNPDCMSPTIGPAATPGEIIDIGVAAHITAASSGGPRFDASLTSEQRKSAANAIWLCQSCAKQVDSDTSTHTVAMLRKWKQDAIDLAARALVLRDPDPDGRLKLARQQQHQFCVRALRSAIAARATILAGIRLARSAIDPQLNDEYGTPLVSKLHESWFGDVRTHEKELRDALLDLRVYWPDHTGAGLVELLVRLLTWRDYFVENVLISIGEISCHRYQHQEVWSWDEVFKGNEQHVKLMKVAIAKNVSVVEEWTRPYIVGQINVPEA